MKEVHEFHVDSARYLDDHGKPLSELPPQAGNTDRVLAAYRNMVLTRTFDSKAIALQRTGKCGTYPSVLGHEVVGTAIGQGMAELIVEGEASVVDLTPLRYSRFAEGDLLSSRYHYKVLA